MQLTPYGLSGVGCEGLYFEPERKQMFNIIFILIYLKVRRSVLYLFGSRLPVTSGWRETASRVLVFSVSVSRLTGEACILILTS